MGCIVLHEKTIYILPQSVHCYVQNNLILDHIIMAPNYILIQAISTFDGLQVWIFIQIQNWWNIAAIQVIFNK